MASRFDAFGLTEMIARPEDAFRLCNLAVAEGTRIRGYRGDYFRLLLGDAAVVIRTMPDENGEPQLLGMDTHAVSSTQWDCPILQDVTPKDADPMSRRLLIGTGLPSEMAVVDVLCADVLPACREGDHVKLNVAAFPIRIDYSTDPADNVISAQEDTILLQGTVKALRVGETYMGMEPMTRFVIATVGTPLGDVDVCHTGDMMRENQKDLVKVGATMSAYCVLSGSAAVEDYAGGVVFDEERDLSVLRETLSRGGREKLLGTMKSECTIRFLERESHGAEENQVLLREIDQAMEGQSARRVDLGVITASQDPAVPVGKKCLLVGDAAGQGYAMLSYLQTDSLGRVREITVTRDPQFEFELA